LKRKSKYSPPKNTLTKFHLNTIFYHKSNKSTLPNAKSKPYSIPSKIRDLAETPTTCTKNHKKPDKSQHQSSSKTFPLNNASKSQSSKAKKWIPSLTPKRSEKSQPQPSWTPLTKWRKTKLPKVLFYKSPKHLPTRSSKIPQTRSKKSLLSRCSMYKRVKLFHKILGLHLQFKTFTWADNWVRASSVTFIKQFTKQPALCMQ
jgi:hypothetical protein